MTARIYIASKTKHAGRYDVQRESLSDALAAYDAEKAKTARVVA